MKAVASPFTPTLMPDVLYFRLVILLTIFIYVRAGRTIYMTRKQIRELSSDIELLSADGDEVFSPKNNKNRLAQVSAVHMQDRTTQDETCQTTQDPLHDARQDESSLGDAPGPCGCPRVSPGDDSAAISTGPATSPRWRRDFNASARQTAAKRRSYELKNAAWSYTKYSFLYFLGILVVWTPSSANRMYAMAHHGATLTPLAFMSALVLPLQGFWNWLIYTVVSWPSCKDLFHNLKARALRLSCPNPSAVLRGSNLATSNACAQGHR